MRRFLAFLAAATAVLGANAASAEAQTIDVRFHTAVTLPHGSCEGEGFLVLCSPVTVPGYGEGTLTLGVTSFVPTSDRCGEYGATTTIDFATVETIVMSESGVVCFPGKSAGARHGGHSFGNPFRQTGTFVVDSGPTELEGLTGTSAVASAGAAFRGVYSIDLE